MSALRKIKITAWLLPLVLMLMVCSQLLGLQHLAEHALDSDHHESCALDAPLDHQCALLSDASVDTAHPDISRQIHNLQKSFISRAQGLAWARAPPAALS